MSKQTPVQWLVEQLGLDATTDYLDEIQQALQMEKEQINSAHITGYVIGGGEGDLYEPENYYNETYGDE